MLFRIGEEYEAMARRARSVPPNSAELVKLRSFVHEAETEIVFQLEDRLREILQYIIFLSDYSLLTPVEIKTNNFAFKWYNN